MKFVLKYYVQKKSYLIRKTIVFIIGKVPICIAWVKFHIMTYVR